jgi:hypothetical protein
VLIGGIGCTSAAPMKENLQVFFIMVCLPVYILKTNSVGKNILVLRGLELLNWGSSKRYLERSKKLYFQR